MNYAEALEYLDRHINREAVAGNWDELSLAGPAALMAALGDPHRDYPVIHVTGTNGKGTVVAMIERLLAASGVVAGTFTSPHIESLTERIARNAEPIGEDDFARIVGDIAAVCDHGAALTPSYFELLTAAAFSWFSEVAVEAAVVEVGIFGRFDATNVVEAEVAVITNIGKDHTDGAPGWREKIAYEKAGIIKPESAVVLGEADPEIRSIFTDEAAGALYVVGEDYEVVESAVSLGGRMVSFRTPSGALDDILVPRHGDHEAANAATAIMAVEAFFGRALDADVVREAFEALELPGRFEIVGREPLLILDGAHNPPAAQVLAQTLAEEFHVGGTRIAVVGMLGRDPDEFFEALDVGEFDLVIATQPASGRAVDAQEIARSAGAAGVASEVVPTVSDAVDRARVMADDFDMVVVTGSLYTVGEARAHLRAEG